MPNDLNPTSVFQLLDDLRIDGDTPYVFHIAASDRLAIGNDGQGFHDSTGVLGGLFWVQLVQIDPQFRAALKPPTCGNRDQLQAALGPIQLQLF